MPRVSKATAYKHRKDAIERDSVSFSLPFPTICNQSESSASSSSSSTSSSPSDSRTFSFSSHNSEQDGQSKEDAEADSPGLSIPEQTQSGLSIPDSTESEGAKSDEIDNLVEPEANTEADDESSESAVMDSLDSEDLQLITEIDAVSLAEINLKSTMTRCLWILQFRLKYHLVDEAVDFLLVREKSLYPDDVKHSTFKGLRKAICTYADLNIETQPHCEFGHKALGVREDGSVEVCNRPKCSGSEQTRIGYYKYISLWDQLSMLIQSDVYGPLLFNSYQEKLRNLDISSDAETEWYSDFCDGSDFKRFVRRQGGVEKVMDSIFLDISTDGVQPYQSSNYSYWPVISFVCNIPPEERSKIKNVLASMFIPGSRPLKSGPSDLHSYLKPLYNELQYLGKNGKSIERWDGKVIKCKTRPWRIRLDEDACRKIGLLTGFNGMAPSRFGHFHGAWCEAHRHYYFPDKS